MKRALAVVALLGLGACAQPIISTKIEDNARRSVPVAICLKPLARRGNPGAASCLRSLTGGAAGRRAAEPDVHRARFGAHARPYPLFITGFIPMRHRRGQEPLQNSAGYSVGALGGEGVWRARDAMLVSDLIAAK